MDGGPERWWLRLKLTSLGPHFSLPQLETQGTQEPPPAHCQMPAALLPPDLTSEAFQTHLHAPTPDGSGMAGERRATKSSPGPGPSQSPGLPGGRPSPGTSARQSREGLREPLYLPGRTTACRWGCPLGAGDGQGRVGRSLEHRL